MILGKIKKILFLIPLLIFFCNSIYALEEVQITPIIKLEDVTATFEEEKDELEKEENEVYLIEKTIDDETTNEKKTDKIYVSLKTLDKITAKTSSIKIAIGEKMVFGQLEVKPLKCAFSDTKNFSDITAYLQVKDLSKKDNNQVFVFNGWTFASSPTLKSIDQPVYDIWLVGCDNI